MTEALKVTGSIPVDLPVANNQRFLFLSKDQRLYTHSIHKYPAKFFPELPRWIIEKYSKQGDLVLDPFMGSGTTNLEASLLGRNSIGVDVDKFSRFVSTAKTTFLEEKALISAKNQLLDLINQYETKSFVNGIPEFPYRDNWFKPYILKELAYIKFTIQELDHSQEVKNFFLVCFSSVIRAVSQADNNCTRTVIRKKLNKKVSKGDAISLFLKRVENNTKGMIGLAQAKPKGDVYIPDDLDARNLNALVDDSVDLALTSPPYMNAVDYPRTHQLELYWLGFASGSLKELKQQHVGTEVVVAKDYKKLHKTTSKQANKTIESIYELDPRRAYIASKYIDDMESNLREVYRVLKPGKRYVVVIGNNLVRGIRFESWRYFKEIAPSIGFEVEKNFISGIINHFIKVPREERINDDHILVLKK
ncbi:MAG: DNA methyltransferase [Rhodobacteraceae bacterium]|nr:DNA methyltransferase [Paracoccaceae bacterium]